ncbi:hypothetical protein B0T26DRAFT_99171 [Lasiosphaeria miniovina]|uniref:F-box domain-containing protein n=1 Tax=Lasiosphaeria miniovina TaxID=1954250 RepID=A0AA40BJ78_9PEZI|nr:uncharacterized protein B0T26DRAFT_99171 [Lasiosphaeria miniovina]KAK0735237.1 hypothetical protein B0T26DRAFT_99171 [Lasiosphaeria miniovina]
MAQAAALISDIVVLPDEILLQVLQLVGLKTRCWCPSPFCHFRCSHDHRAFDAKRFFPLLLVCRRFLRIALPLLYESLVFDSSQSPGPSSPRHELCRRLDVSAWTEMWTTNQPDTLLKVKTATCLSFTPNNPVNSKPECAKLLLDVLGNNSTMQYLQISFLEIANKPELARNILRQVCRLKHLKVLDMVDNSVHDQTQDPTGITSLCRLRVTDDEMGTASFRRLRVTGTPDSIGHFASLSRTLEHFIMNVDVEDVRLNLPDVRQMLLPHRATLETLEIGVLGEHQVVKGRLDLGDFTALKQLTLATPRLNYSGFAKAFVMLGPSLETFVWDARHSSFYSSYEDYKWTSIDDEVETWLTSLAHDAVRYAAPLRNIHIKYEPERVWITKDISPTSYPWVKLEMIQQKIVAMGLNCSYSPPKITEQEFREKIESEIAYALPSTEPIRH